MGLRRVALRHTLLSDLPFSSVGALNFGRSRAKEVPALICSFFFPEIELEF